MALIEDPNVPGNVARVESDGSMRGVLMNRGDGYKLDLRTGTMTAALAVNNICFGMRLDPGAGKIALIHRVTMVWQCVVAFTAPVTIGRRLALYRGAFTGPFTGGTDIVDVAELDSTKPQSEFVTGQGGSTRVSTTAVLGLAGTFANQPLASMDLTNLGAANATAMREFNFDDVTGGPIVINEGEGLAIRWPQAMDAAGTWSLGLGVEWSEVVNLV